jgi:hypothetical protein
LKAEWVGASPRVRPADGKGRFGNPNGEVRYALIRTSSVDGLAVVQGGQSGSQSQPQRTADWFDSVDFRVVLQRGQQETCTHFL